jgi:hypothetical protein
LFESSPVQFTTCRKIKRAWHAMPLQNILVSLQVSRALTSPVPAWNLTIKSNC